MFTPRSYSNPVLDRELRVRWRGGRLPLALMGFSTLLSIGMVSLYINASFNRDALVLPETSNAGHSLFMGLSMVQLVLWLLIAPLLTATAISSERERGMLEAMQLSRISASEIVLGKFVSSLSSIVLLMLAAIPVSAICFLLGGISPTEFLLSALLNFITACTGAAFGLACSAWSRRANTSIPLTYFSVALWLIVTAAFLHSTRSSIYSQSGPIPPSFFGSFDFSASNPFTFAVNTFIFSNPLISMGLLLDNNIANINPVLSCLVMQTGLIVLLLRLAAHGTRKIFPDQPMQQRKKVLGLRYENGGLTLGWQPVWEGSSFSPARYSAVERDIDEEEAVPETPAQPAWHSVPLLSFIRFKNPVLHREFHCKFRLRFSAWLVALGLVIFLPLAFFYLSFWFLILDTSHIASAANGAWLYCAMGGLALGGFLMAVMSARAFAREKETGSWDALQLSLLPRRQIIAGKLLASIAFCTILALPWYLMLASGIRGIAPGYVVTDYMYGVGHVPSFHPAYDRVSLLQAACALWILYGTLSLCGATGLWISWRSRHTIAAVSWTLGVLAGIWTLLPMIHVAFFTYFWRSDFIGLSYKLSQLSGAILNTVHPFRAMPGLFSNISYTGYYFNPLLAGFICGLIQFSLAAVLLVHLHRSMHRHTPEVPAAWFPARWIPARWSARFSSSRKPVMQN